MNANNDLLNEIGIEIAGRTLSKAIKLTPVNTGYLRRGWTFRKTEQPNGVLIVDVINPVEYAPYVEYGHRINKNGGWIEGKFMLTNATADIKRDLDEIVKRRLTEFLKNVK